MSDIVIFPCDCNTEGLVVTQFDDTLAQCQEAPYLEIAFWAHGHPVDPGWKYRFRHIWHILKTGRPYVDMVCLNKNTAKKFAEYILTELSKSKKEKK